MAFFALGINHQTAPVAVREAFALDGDALTDFYDALPASAEAVCLSTCNRTEVYLCGSTQDARAAEQLLALEAGQPWPSSHTFRLEDEEAVRHVLAVACGLQSLVLGDAQIFAQLKEAYREAVEVERVDAAMHRLMHTAFRTARRVARETNLGRGAASVSSAAVAVARAFCAEHQGGDSSLVGKRALLVGTGRMGVLALQALAGSGVTDLLVTNRTAVHAERVAEAYGARTLPWDERHHAAAEADVVIVATGAPEPVLRAADLPAAQRNVLVVDIAVPRNVEPAADALPRYHVLDLDALNDRLLETESRRRAAVPAARAVVQDEAAEFVAWYFHQQAMQPAIQSLRETFEAIRQEEIARHAHRFEAADAEDLNRLTRSIMQKLLAVPIVRLKAQGRDSLDFVRGIETLDMLFARPTCEDASDEPEHEQARRARRAQREAGHQQAAEAEQRAKCPIEQEDEA